MSNDFEAFVVVWHTGVSPLDVSAMHGCARLVLPGVSLPFCAPDRFPEVWRAVTHALRGGGGFAGHFFGPHDSWASTRT
jgi:hypothetical protein